MRRREIQTDRHYRQTDRQNSKTLFYKDCSLGSVTEYLPDKSERDRQTDRQSVSQSVRKTDTETERERGRETDRRSERKEGRRKG